MTGDDPKAADLDRELPEHHPYKAKRDRPQYEKNKPHCIYYYHVTDINTNPWKIKHYYHADNGDIRRGDLKELARTLGRNAWKTHGTPPTMAYQDFKSVYWTRISYIMFLFDIPGVRLAKNQAIEIVHEDAGGHDRPNHSFFDAGDFRVDLSNRRDGSHECDVVYCVNHLQKAMSGGRLAEEETQYFVLNFKFERGASGAVPFRSLPNSGGTNQGGGVAPPDV